MRRKSERNKTKPSSPEKKVEKPTRRITRRRGRQSPSPEQQSAEDSVSSTPYSQDEDPQLKAQGNNDGEGLEKDVSSSELIKSVLGGGGGAAAAGGGSEEDSGSVWKVARADASPGEIQKLKLCRQRNISEASSDSSISNKKKSNKWPDSGDGGQEEADSVDEQAASCEMPAGERAEDPSSSHPGQDSSQEVSDREILPEATSVNLSDDQTNIDQQGVFTENLQQETALPNPAEAEAEAPVYEDTQSSSPPANLPADDSSQPPSSGDYAAEIPSEYLPSTQSNDDQENSNQAVYFPSTPTTTTTTAAAIPVIEPPESEDTRTSVNDEESTNNANEAICAEQINQDSNVENVEETVPTYQNDDQEKDREDESAQTSKQGSSPQDTFANDETNSEVVVINNETSDTDFVDSRKESGLDEEEEGEIRDEPEKEQDSDSGPTRGRYSPDARESRNERSQRHKSKKHRSSKSKEDSASTNLEIDSIDSNLEKEDILEINEKSDDLNVSSVSCSKPTKVSLKRSFSNRLSTDAEAKKDESSSNKSGNNESNQNKENHADNEQPDQKCQTKRRRWGTTTTTTTTDIAPAFSISTDSLKALVPGAKPVPANEVKLTKDEDEEKEQRSRKKKSSVDDEPKSDLVLKNDVGKKSESKTDNHTASRRKITITKETPRPISPSLPEAQATNILLIRNLVRPFTLNQIKELLSRTGTIVENGFWMDRIKSKCFVEYANEDQAFETRQALHGVSWPLSNPKKLIVEYATKEDMTRESSKEQQQQPVAKKIDPLLSADLWQQDSWARDERPTAVNKITVIREWDLGKEDGQLQVKDKERERKEFEKKKRQRSRSPALETHLPAPARKFKKKEEEPPTAKLLDDLFRKTKATPCIYWLPLTNEQIAVKEEIRRQHMAEHARRLEEIRRVERGRSRGDIRRRRSPRK